jgi:hypothetical protein|tara:strand:- start:3830 stop:4462 length:633 start_codon:yes stop_codon:yes gene_type:complete
MFFVRQRGNHCGLHAIQNMFKTAAVTAEDMHSACEKINTDTGDPILNHESLGGDWSVEAIVTAICQQGYDVYRAVQSREQRCWSGASIEELLTQQQFRGIILHQPMRHHFACIRPENVDGDVQLYYVDSQSTGPIRISPRLAERRCLALAYSWEPYVVMGDEMDYVAPKISIMEASAVLKERPRVRPSTKFMQDWEALENMSKKQKVETQ